MKFALVGVGGAGGRLVEQFRRAEKETGRSFSKGSLLAFDTQKAAFEQYSEIPLDRHVLLGDLHSGIRGEGVGGDVDLAADVARQDDDEIYREFDKLDVHNLDAVVVAAGLGGGTGGGAGPVIVDRLKTITENPVYGLGVLPDRSEPDQQALNAARSLQSFVRISDGVVLFDNDSWHNSDKQGPLADRYGELNRLHATRFLSVFALGELDSAEIAENTLDSSDIFRTLTTGGVASIGYASTELDVNSGFFSRLLSKLRNGEKKYETEGRTVAMRTNDLIKRAATRQLTLPCSIASADRALIVLSGPPEECSRKGFESGRHWLEEETGAVEVFAGDEPRPDASSVSAAILFSNVTEVPRIDELQRRAVAAKSGTPQSHGQDQRHSRQP